LKPPREEIFMRTSVIALTLLLAGTAFAQAPPAPPTKEARSAQMMDNLTVLLDLTDAQRPQVQAILEQQHTQMRAEFDQAKAAGTKPDFSQMKATHDQMQAETLQKLTPILSASQLKKFQVLEQMEHEHFHHRGPPPGAPPPPAQ
jgi:Spy/CpxP family protein refolding chaperone